MKLNKVIVLILVILLPINLYAQVVTTKTQVVSVTPVIETSAYAANDVVGELLTLNNVTAINVQSGIISDIVITDLDRETVDLNVAFFSANPSASTFTDNAAFDPADADLPKLICVVPVNTHYDFNDNGASLATNINCPFRLDSGNTSLYAVIVATAAVTYTSASDLTLRVGILQD